MVGDGVRRRKCSAKDKKRDKVRGVDENGERMTWRMKLGEDTGHRNI